MKTNINYGKILLVLFLTILIWVWADMALDEDLPVFNTRVNIAKAADSKLWASFSNESSILIKKMVLRGSGSRIAEVRRKLNEGSLVFDFFLNPDQERMSAGQQYVLNTADFLKENDQIRRLGLAVRSCEPDKLIVDVVELVKMPLVVKCVDEEQLPVKTATVEPAQVEMFVPKDWSGEKLSVKVLLTRREINQARSSAIEKTPYIELAVGQIREAPMAVKITTMPEEDRLSDYTITTARLGFALSANLQGKYKVVVTNLNEVIRTITIRATPDAKRAYDKMRYQVVLEIDDSDKDVKSAEPLRRELIYNFPPEYVRKDEIALNQQPVVARFNLIPLPVAEVQPIAEP